MTAVHYVDDTHRSYNALVVEGGNGEGGGWAALPSMVSSVERVVGDTFIEVRGEYSITLPICLVKRLGWQEVNYLPSL